MLSSWFFVVSQVSFKMFIKQDWKVQTVSSAWLNYTKINKTVILISSLAWYLFWFFSFYGVLLSGIPFSFFKASLQSIALFWILALAFKQLNFNYAYKTYDLIFILFSKVFICLKRDQTWIKELRLRRYSTRRKSTYLIYASLYCTRHLHFWTKKFK